MRSMKVHWVVGLKQKQWLAEEFFSNIIHMQTYNWTKYALCGSTLSGWLQAETMASRRNFSKHYTYSNIQLNKLCTLLNTVSVGLQAQAKLFWRKFLKQYTHSNIQLNKVCLLWKYTEWLDSIRSIGFQKKFFKTLYTFKHTIEQILRSVKVHWVLGFKQKQWLSKEVFQNTTNIQTYNWTKYALCESTQSGGLQAEALVFRRSFSKHDTNSNIQLNKICTLLKYRECWASSTSKAFLKKFFKTIYIFKHAIEQWMRSVRVHWAVGFRQKQWLAEVVFLNIIHMQTYNWTKYALCECTLSGALRTEAMAFRNFSKHYTHANIQLNEKCALWNTLSGWLQAEAMASRRIFSKHYTYSNIQLNKVCILLKYSECWASSTSKAFLKKFFETIHTFKHAIEQRMRSVRVHWAVGFRQKQWLAEVVFLNIIHMQTYNWTKYALCECTLSGALRTEAMAFRKFSKHYTHANIQLKEKCALWKYTEWLASSRSNGFQKKFFKTLYIFKHAIEQSMRSVKVHWALGFRQKQWLSEEVFWNIIHIQTCNWTKYALCESTLSIGPQAEALVFRRSFSKPYTHSNIQLNEVCALWKYTEWWASSRSNGLQK